MEAKAVGAAPAQLRERKSGGPRARADGGKYAQLAAASSALLAPLHFAGRTEKGDADEETPLLR